MTNSELLEKAEILRSTLMTSVTGGAKNEEDFQKLRRELVSVEAVKTRLPLWVRTAGDLTVIFHHVSSKEDPNKPGGKWQKRRQYITDEFAPLVDYLSGEGRFSEAFFPKGSDHDAYVHIKTILKRATSELVIIDGYMDGTIFQVLGALPLPATIDIRILTSKVPADFALERGKFLKQHPMSVEVRSARDFHDRFIFVDKKECHLLGASIKDAGSRGCVILAITEDRIVDLIYKYATTVWASAATI